MSEIQTAFQGEIQLAGWSETHNGGCKVTFWLPEAAELEAFRALTVRKGNTAGHRFMAVMVEIGDDEEPVQQTAPEKPRGGALAKLAGMWCAEPVFWDWLRADGWASDEAMNADKAAQAVRKICFVESRAELDTDESAKRMFDERIRGPYSKYRARVGA